MGIGSARDVIKEAAQTLLVRLAPEEVLPNAHHVIAAPFSIPTLEASASTRVPLLTGTIQSQILAKLAIAVELAPIPANLAHHQQIMPA